MWPSNTGHTGSWGVKDFGVTEFIGSLFGAPKTPQGGSDIFPNAQPSTPPPPPPLPEPKGGTTSGGAPGAKPATSQPAANPPATTQNPIDTAQQSQEDAARVAAEARRQAALRKYQAQVGIAGQAKEQAKGSYDWIIDTIGSNKKDVLEKVALEETQGVEGYGQQEDKTKRDYDSAKQQILSMYRDLQREQEKILRGAGLGQSSRSIEAQMKLNNLLGKDLGGVSTNEADSLALIGNAVSALKDRSLQTRVSVEREAQGKLDKAALDYKAQVDAIDANTQLAGNEREDAYAQAEVQLATDIANIQSWAAGLKLQQEQTNAKLKELVDGYISDMTSTNALLNTDLTTKKQATNSVLSQIGLTPLDIETGAQTTSLGVKQKTTTKKPDEDLSLLAGVNISSLINPQTTPAVTAPAPVFKTPEDELIRAALA